METALDKHAVARIRASFELLAPRGQQLVDAFYARLFAAAPSVRSLFPADMTSQKGHLLATLGLAVKHVDDLGALAGPLADMGARHVGYGAQPEHYPVVRDILIATLADAAGPAWNEALHADWNAALNAIADAMLNGAHSAALRAH
jgi:hemoglobin-like flavoprotein